MLDFLSQADINDIDLERINTCYDDAMKYNLHINAENCLGIILYLKKKGIKNIEDLLIDKPEWFLKTTNEFINMIESNKNLINSINNYYDN